MELSGLVTAILLIFIFGLFYWLLTKDRTYWEKRGVFYITSSPLLGITKDMILDRKSMGEVWDEIYYKKLDGKKFGGLFQLGAPTIFIRDPELINQVLIKDFGHFEDRVPSKKASRDLFSLSLFSMSGNEWRNARHKLTPTFTSGKLKRMFESIKECSDEAVDYMEEKIGHDIEAKDFMLRYVLNVIGRVAFGMKLNILNANDDDLSKKFLEYSSKFFMPTMLGLLKMIIFGPNPKLAQIFKVKFISNDVELFFRKLTHDVIRYRESTNTKRNDFLDLMLDLKKKEQEYLQNGVKNSNSAALPHQDEPVDCEDKELMDQLNNTPLGSPDSNQTEIFTEEFMASQSFIFIAAGSESTAAILSFVLYELAINQDLQKKVLYEIKNVLSTQDLNYHALRKMTYLEQFINETFRLFPLTPALTRICTSDYKIPGTDVLIEKGTLITIPVCSLQKDPQYFPDPETFNPDRFEKMDAFPKGVYFPFGGGPRICVAMRLAILEMKVVLVSLLLNYDIALGEKMQLPMKLDKKAIVVRPEGGMWIKFNRRDNK